MMYRLNRMALLSGIALTIAACASSSDKIEASYVSPMKYNSFNCSQMTQEYARLSQEASITNKQQNDIADNDAAAMGVGLILFWPALFFIDTDDKREEVARLKGEIKAVEEVSISKDCTALSRNIQDDKAAFARALAKQKQAEQENSTVGQ